MHLSPKPGMTQTHRKRDFLISKRAELVLITFENLLPCCTLYFKFLRKVTMFYLQYIPFQSEVLLQSVNSIVQSCYTVGNMDTVMESALDAGHNNTHRNKIMPEQSSPFCTEQYFHKKFILQKKMLNVILKRCIECGLFTNALCLFVSFRIPGKALGHLRISHSRNFCHKV